MICAGVRREAELPDLYLSSLVRLTLEHHKSQLSVYHYSLLETGELLITMIWRTRQSCQERERERRQQAGPETQDAQTLAVTLRLSQRSQCNAIVTFLLGQGPPLITNKALTILVHSITKRKPNRSFFTKSKYSRLFVVFSIRIL